MKPHVLLTWDELEVMAWIAVRKHLASKQAGFRDRYGAKDGWDKDLNGFLGEGAVSKYHGEYWLPGRAKQGYGEGDVGKRFVRTRPPNRDHLPLHPDDEDTGTHILVLGPTWAREGAYFVLAGWIRGLEGKARPQTDPWGTGRPCFWVPLAELKDVPLETAA